MGWKRRVSLSVVLTMNEIQLVLLAARALGFVLALQLPLKKTLPYVVWISLVVVLLLASAGNESVSAANPGLHLLSATFAATDFDDIDSLAHIWSSRPTLIVQNVAIGLSLGLIASVIGYAMYFISTWLTSLSLGHYFDLTRARFDGQQASVAFVIYLLFGYLLFSVIGFSHVATVFTETLTAVPIEKSFDSSLTTSQFVPLLASIGAKSFEFGLLCIAPLLLISLLVDITFAVIHRYANAFATADVVYAVRQPIIIFAFAALTILFTYVLINHLGRSVERARIFGSKYLTSP